MSLWGFPAGAERGRWTALLAPINSRRMKFHLLQRSHVEKCAAVVRNNADGTPRCEPVKDYAVTFQFTELHPAGMVHEMPTTLEGNSDLHDFLQVIVDCAAQMGITPSEGPDLSGEMQRTKDHLEDMRRLVFKANYEPIEATPPHHRH